MRFNDYKLLCNRGSAKYNEDIAAISPYGAWVIDGATGLNNKNLVSEESDAKWYVNWWNTYLHNNINRKESLKDIIGDGIEIITEEYYKLIGNEKIEKIDLPSAACSIIKFHEDKIEYLVLGDCTLFFKDEESLIALKDEILCVYDKKVYDFIGQLADSENMTFAEKKEKVMPIIVDNRLKKNTKEGYWILGFDKEVTNNCIYGFMELKTNAQIMLTSDGFSCAYDRYEIISEEEIIQLAKDEGIDYIYKKIRATI